MHDEGHRVIDEVFAKLNSIDTRSLVHHVSIYSQLTDQSFRVTSMQMRRTYRWSNRLALQTFSVLVQLEHSRLLGVSLQLIISPLPFVTVLLR